MSAKVLRCRGAANGELTVRTNFLVGIRDIHQHNIAVGNVFACSTDCAGNERRLLLRLDPSNDQHRDKVQEGLDHQFHTCFLKDNIGSWLAKS